MHRKNKWIILTTFFLFFTLLICGCWSRKELETLAFVTTVGIDKAEEPGKIKVTLQMVDTTKIRPPGGGGWWGRRKTGFKHEKNRPYLLKPSGSLTTNQRGDPFSLIAKR